MYCYWPIILNIHLGTWEPSNPSRFHCKKSNICVKLPRSNVYLYSWRMQCQSHLILGILRASDDQGSTANEWLHEHNYLRGRLDNDVWVTIRIQWDLVGESIGSLPWARTRRAYSSRNATCSKPSTRLHQGHLLNFPYCEGIRHPSLCSSSPI